MPSVFLNTGAAFVPFYESPKEPKGLPAAIDGIENLTAGFLDENLVGLAAKNAVDYIFNEERQQYEIDPNYDVFNDPKFKNYKPFIGNFLHAKNEYHASKLLEDFLKKQKQISGSPSYIVGRILGGVLDPSSLLFFTKAGRYAFTGSRLARSAKFGSTVALEETAKRYIDDNRPVSDTVLISAGGFILPALFPGINARAGKKFDDYQKMYDEADDASFNNKGTVSAASPGGTRLMNEDDYTDLNKISPTGMGVFGENGPFNPVFRVLKNGIASAQEFIETTLEFSLLQNKNWKGLATSPNIERSVKSRFSPLIKSTMVEVESLYTEYLKRMGLDKQNIVERAVDTKFGAAKQNILTPKEFRKQIWLARHGFEEEVVPEAVKAATGPVQRLYKTIGEEYDALKIPQTYLERQLERIDDILKNIKNPKKKEELQSVRQRIQERLDYIEANGSLSKSFGTNILYKRDIIANRFDEFKAILTKFMPGASKLEIDEIAEGFKYYQPTIAFNKFSDEFAKEAPDIEGFINKINQISARFKGRSLKIGKDGYRALADAGFVETDVQLLQKLYFNQTIPDIEITKIFGDPMGYGTKWTPDGTFKQGILQIAKEYDEMIEATTSVVQKNKLLKQKEEILKDLDASIHLIRGTYGLADDPNRAFSRGIRIGKLYNSMTMLTGIAQVVDTARLIMVNGVGKTFRLSWEVMTSGYAKEMAKMSKNSAQLGGEALDMWNSSRAFSMYDIDDAFGVFNKFERAASTVGNLYFTFLNLSNPWNASVKSIASMFNGTRLIEIAEQISKGQKVTKVNKARMASLGIEDDMAKRIYDQYIKYGVGKNGKTSHKVNGDDYKEIRVANSESWVDKEAADVYHSAIGKQVNIDIVTPSKGDVPLWANTEMGGVLLQFKKFGMASTQRMLMRGLQERDANFFSGVLLLLGAGAMVDAFRQKAFNRSYAKKPFGQKVVDAFDRSGLGGIYSDINNAIERLGNNQIGLRPLLGAKKPYGTYRDLLNNPIPDVLGPTASQIANIADIVWTAGSGKYNHHTARNVRRLVPFQNVWFLDSLFDSMEKNVLR